MGYESVLHTIPGINLVVTFKKFDENEQIFENEYFAGFFRSEPAWTLAVVEKCIEDHNDVFRVMDEIGYSAEKTPKVIIAELAEKAFELNPHFLDQKPDFRQNREKTRKERKKREIRLAEKRALDEFEQFTLENAKNAILPIFANFEDSVLAGKLGISENKLKKLKTRNWTFRDCLSIAGKFDLDVEVVFGRFRRNRRE